MTDVGLYDDSDDDDDFGDDDDDDDARKDVLGDVEVRTESTCVTVTKTDVG